MIPIVAVPVPALVSIGHFYREISSKIYSSEWLRINYAWNARGYDDSGHSQTRKVQKSARTVGPYCTNANLCTESLSVICVSRDFCVSMTQ